MREIMFSRAFPKGHPKEGHPTYFIEKIWSWMILNMKGFWDFDVFLAYEFIDDDFYNNTDWQKGHTIRKGHRFKVGDWFVPKVWSDKPYRSKKVIIGPPMQVKKVFQHYLHGCGINC